jgi:hypothetical protein
LPSKPPRDQRGVREEQSSPTRFPDTTPPSLPSGDYSYTLEIVMKMQFAIGKLTEAVDGLKESQKDQGQKLDRISHQVYAAIVLIVLVGAILTFFAKSINDIIVHQIFAPAQQQQQPSPSVQQQPATQQQQPKRN